MRVGGVDPAPVAPARDLGGADAQQLGQAALGAEVAAEGDHLVGGLDGHAADDSATQSVARNDHDWIRPRTSSRRRSMSSRETSDSRHSRSSGSVFEVRTLKCQSS